MRSTATTDQLTSPPPAVMTIREFCEWSRMGKTAVYAQAKAGRLKLRKIGAKTVVIAEDAESWRRALPAAA